ncbi:hypothetical protein N7528_002443 [Penicillium herquei]|nr:hypothetical protein N7528_002443 [Penicillium herquei]
MPSLRTEDIDIGDIDGEESEDIDGEESEDIDGDLDHSAPAICSLCGVIIYDFSLATWSSNPLDVLEESEFEVYRRKGRAPEHILVPSSKIESAGFSKFPWLANSYFRAVTLSTSPSGFNYHLTGITLYQENDPTPLCAPRDKNMARISGRRRSPRYNNLQFISFRPMELEITDVIEPPTDKGNAYLFHAHCWEVMCHIQGKETIEERLPDLVQAIKQFWTGLYASFSSLDHDPQEVRWGYSDQDLDFWVRVEDEVLHTKYEWYNCGCDTYISPWVVPEVHAAIASSRAQRTAYKPQCPNRLPPECWLLILDLICPLQYTQRDVQDLRSLMSVFVFYAPESFWIDRLQIHGDILLELDNLGDATNDDSLDWPTLWLNLMDLLSNGSWFVSSGLATRKRALQSIRGILRNFQQDP